MSDRRRVWRAGSTLLAAALASVGCAGPDDSAPSRPLGVAVSVPPQAFLVERIAGERAEVEVMIPPAASPATYEPSPRQQVALARARLYVRVGHPGFAFETRHVERLLRRRSDLRVVDMWAAAGSAARQGAEDPHLWLSPTVVERTVREIASALTDLDRDGARVYGENLESLLADIRRLDRELRAALAPLAGRRFLVFHPAWGWFASEYGLEQVAIESGGREPGLAGLTRLIERARQDGVRVVFVQRGFSDRSARVIAAEIGGRVEQLDPLAFDWLTGLRQAGESIAQALFEEDAGNSSDGSP